MDIKNSKSILKEINEFKQLIKRVESRHSFSIINFESMSDEEKEIYKEFNIEDKINSLFPISEYEEGNFENLTHEEALLEIKKWLKEAFDFNIRFSSKEREGNLIRQEVNDQIEKITNLLKETILQSIKVEIRTANKGGYNLVRLDFVQDWKNEILEFNYFID